MDHQSWWELPNHCSKTPCRVARGVLSVLQQCGPSWPPGWPGGAWTTALRWALPLGSCRQKHIGQHQRLWCTRLYCGDRERPATQHDHSAGTESTQPLWLSSQRGSRGALACGTEHLPLCVRRSSPLDASSQTERALWPFGMVLYLLT